ncbi:MAG TPA: hypothetical protein VKD90_09595 [Gemmataceae bacterium]|nr:hypothetical protein [Gemmataceae bacterium]
MAGSPGGSRSRNGAEQMVVTVRCPNEGCGKVYTVPARYAGRRAECAHCGTRTIIPAAAGMAPARRTKGSGNGRARSAGYEVRVGCIGRGHAGKTALFQVLGDSLVGEFLQSGLHLDAADPREVARMIREAEEAHKLLRQSGLPPTLEVSHNRYCVYEGDKRRVICKMREVIGQVLTHTLPNSEPQLQARYVDYIKNLVNAHVLWVVVPCPPADPQQRDRRRYANDLRITMAYLREALRLRTRPELAGVALVLSKTDALFQTAEEARAALTDDVLLQALGPLVQLIEQSQHVSDAAIVPVTAFGFGKAVLHPEADERHGAPGSAEEPFGDEPIWLLREGESPAPYNLDTLFLWTLLLGLLNQAGPNPAARPKLDKVCRMLRDDLEAGSPWLVPFKGGVSLTTA